VRRRRAVAALALAVGPFLGACADGRSEPEVQAAAPSDDRAPVTYVSLGTDETEARYLGFPHSLRQAWPQVIFRTTLPQRAVFVNLADDGATVAEALDRQLPAALELAPSLATVWLTATDADEGTAPAAYETDLATLITALRRGGRTRVLVATSTALDPAPALDAAVERVTRATGADLVDLRRLDLGGASRPDRRSHRRLADAFARVLGEVR
jgi:hypothetical protein